ncbi:MAG: TIGR01244 family phosphatase [Betaproteobacteria bacterium]|jgi:uncharacterized protein (TIGR01244 family)|nr:TIGR01244 family phosphatase [Betaproteobacteria bacterium]HAB48319.1 TIGR01244 family phosphatase [Lautropia sp.]NBO95691.1 TIGR01244 family phosphatase [Betaproteobacteria bacterium]NBP35494.1 TIGR01244 family phosphatase [Betaproteobacteria bacterium]NBQ79042.1 TIGR01244 family phosphatase [Betaproteobacteria bacterium]
MPDQENDGYKAVDLPFFAALDQNLAVAGQINPEDMAAIRAAGFVSVINNRPDGEGGPSQPSDTQMKSAAENAGLRYVYQPVVSSDMTMDDVICFHEHLKVLPKPVLAYCRTGARCTRLYQSQ